MKGKLINSQLTNIRTIESYRRRMCSMAENVLLIKNLPEYIDTGFMNKTLLRRGAIVFFVDEVFGLLALPMGAVSVKDMYGRPMQVQVKGLNGKYLRTLSNVEPVKIKDGRSTKTIYKTKEIPEFVIMYDNQSKLPIFNEILQLSERIALSVRISDINILNQKTSRIIVTSDEKLESVKSAMNEIDGNESCVITLDNDFLKDTNAILTPAPYVADKLQENKDKLWGEFLTLIGIPSSSEFQKKERNIRDEVKYSQGGTIANRYSRFESRKKAIDMINKYLIPKHNEIPGIDQIEKLEVEFYDGLPTTLESDEGRFEDPEVFNKNDTQIEDGGDSDVL